MSKPLSAVEFAEAVITHWPPFRWDEHQETSWTQALVREIGGFDQEVLGKALAALIRTRRDTKTPTVAICIDACSTERRYAEAQKRIESLPIEAKPEERDRPWYSPQRTDLADTLVKCPLGKQAAKEGWLGAMYAFAVEHGRLPLANAHVPAPKPGPHPIRPYVGMTEIAMCKQQAKDFDDAFALCVRGEIVADGHQGWTEKGTMMAKAQIGRWESIGAAMLEERQKLANMVLEAR